MTITTFISTHEKTNVTNKELKELLEEYPYITENFIVKENTWIEKKLFSKNVTHTSYSVYYKLLSPYGDRSWIGDVQCITLPGGPNFNTVYSYFLGIAGTIHCLNYKKQIKYCNYKTELDYLTSLHKQDFDTSSLSVKGYEDEMKAALNKFPCLLSFFFNHLHLVSLSSIDNFLSLILSTESFKDILLYKEQLFELCEHSDISIADKTLQIFSCLKDNGVEFEYNQLLNLDFKMAYLVEYAEEIVNL